MFNYFKKKKEAKEQLSLYNELKKQYDNINVLPFDTNNIKFRALKTNNELDNKHYYYHIQYCWENEWFDIIYYDNDKHKLEPYVYCVSKDFPEQKQNLENEIKYRMRSWLHNNDQMSSSKFTYKELCNFIFDTLFKYENYNNITDRVTGEKNDEYHFIF